MTKRLGPDHPLVWVIGLLAALLGIAGYSLRDILFDGASSQTAPVATTTIPASSSQHDNEAVTTTTALSQSTSTSYLPSRIYLSELRAVAQSLDVSHSAAELGGDPYGNSLIFTCELYCDDSAALARTAYNLGGDFVTFSTVAGILDSAPDTAESAVFTVIVDGVERFKDTVTFGDPKPVGPLDVRGALRLELLITTGLQNVSPLQAGVDAAGGRSNPFPHAAWGDPFLVR